MDATSQSEEEYRRNFRKIFAQTGHKTLNALLIVTGGATVAFLGFVGACLKEGAADRALIAKAAPAFALTIEAFVVSVGLCILMHFTTYLSHGAYHFRRDKIGNWLGGITIFLGFACLFVFIFGSVQAIRGFEVSAQALSEEKHVDSSLAPAPLKP